MDKKTLVNKKVLAITMVAVALVSMLGFGLVYAQENASASRSFDAESVAPGGRVTVTVAATGYGSFGRVTETLPDGFSYDSGSLDPEEVSVTGQTVRFTLQGADKTFTYIVTASSAAGDYDFAGKLRDADRDDHDVVGASSVTVEGGPVTSGASASRSFDAESVAPGGRVTVTVAATGYGSFGRVTETLPDGFSYDSGSLDPEEVSVTGQTVRFTLQGADKTFTYIVTASSAAGDYDFAGKLRDADRDDHDVVGASSVTVEGGPVTSGASASRSFDAESVAPGGRVTVTVAATGYGSFGRVTETLPDGFSYDSGSLDPEEVSVTGQTVRFTLQGADKTFTYIVTASSAAGDYDFAGKLRDADRDDHDVVGASSVTVLGPRATRSFSSTSVRPSGRVTVTVAATGYGSFGRVTETLPDGFSYDSGSLDPEEVSVTGQTVRFTLQGADKTFTYIVTTSSATGSHSFSGTLRDSDRQDHMVGGASSVRVRTASPPPSGGGGGGTPANRAPTFDERAGASRSVAENSAVGTAVGRPVTATDRDRDRITYSLVGGDAEIFDIDSATGQISIAEGTALDFESKSSYAVSVRARDTSGGGNSISITIAVTNVDEAGSVSVSSQEPEVGTALTASLADPDGAVSEVSWSWDRSRDQETWTAISGATLDTYTPVEGDQGHHLRVTVAYTDGYGSGKRAELAFANPVPVLPTPTPTATPEPTVPATPEPTVPATPEPTAMATPEPTAMATPEPTAMATPEPTAMATPEPTAMATPEPTAMATPEPTAMATPEPTATATPPSEPAPSEEPSGLPGWAIILIVIGAAAALIGGSGYIVIRTRQQ